MCCPVVVLWHLGGMPVFGCFSTWLCLVPRHWLPSCFCEFLGGVCVLGDCLSGHSCVLYFGVFTSAGLGAVFLLVHIGRSHAATHQGFSVCELFRFISVNSAIYFFLLFLDIELV